MTTNFLHRFIAVLVERVGFLVQVWPHKEYPLIPVGRVVLNKNPVNYFAEVEQSAFSPAHVVPGIEFSPDKMLQGKNPSGLGEDVFTA